MATDFRALVTADLDTSKVQPKLDKLKPTLTISNYRLDTSKLPNQIQATLSGHKFVINLTGINTKGIETQMSQAATKTGAVFSQKLISKINTEMSNGGIQKSISQVTEQYTRLANSGHKSLNTIRSDIESLVELQSMMANTADDAPELLVRSYNEFNSTLQRTKNYLSIVSAESKTFVSSLQIDQLDNRMSAWIDKNSKAASKYGTNIANLRQRLAELKSQDNVTIADLNAIATEFTRVAANAQAAGLMGRSFGDALKGAISSITKYVSASTLIYKSISTLKEGVKTVVELDTALVDLQKTSTATASQLAKFYSEANEQAKQLGVTTQEIIQASADWSRLG